MIRKPSAEYVSAVSAVVQAIAVVVGIAIAVNEFVITDRIAEAERKNRVVAMFPDYEEVMEAVNDVRQAKIAEMILKDFKEGEDELDERLLKTYKDRLENYMRYLETMNLSTVRFYRKLSFCTQTYQCDGALARALFCDAAVEYGFHMQESPTYVKSLVASDIEVYKFAVGCPVPNIQETMTFGEGEFYREENLEAVKTFREKFMN